MFGFVGQADGKSRSASDNERDEHRARRIRDSHIVCDPAASYMAAVNADV